MKINSGPIAFSAFGVDFYWYGLLLAIAFFSTFVYMLKTRTRLGFTAKQCTSIQVLSIVGGLWGARLNYCVSYWDEFAASTRAQGKEPLIEMFIPAHGLTLHGGIISSIMALALFSRVQQRPLLEVLDFIAPALPIGIAFGRIGCLLNGCCFGVVMPEEVQSSMFGDVFGVEYLLSAYNAFHWHHYKFGTDLYSDKMYATQLYSCLGNLLLCCLLHLLSQKRYLLVPGQLTAVFLVLYPVLRLTVQMYRYDHYNSEERMFASQYFQGITETQLVCSLCMVVGLTHLGRTHSRSYDSARFAATTTTATTIDARQKRE